MYQNRTTSTTISRDINPIPIALYDASDCFVDVIIHTEPEGNTNTYTNASETNETPISIKIIPQVVIPVHECEVIYYEPDITAARNRTHRPDDSLNLYRLCTTIICTGIIFLSLTTILYNPTPV
jgi:hypothetical protein